jgi:3-methyladenine DNA glycosylase AlkD
MTMSAALREIQKILTTKADKHNQAFYERAVPGQQKVYGVKTPELNVLVKQYKVHSFELARELWASGALEEQIIAIKIIEKTGKKDPQMVLKLFKEFSRTINNWAVCDGLGMQFLSGIRQTHAEEIFALAAKYNHSRDPWQRRLSLVMAEWYTRKKEYTAAIKKLVKGVEKDEEYYVRKAVVWINKNFNKRK